LRRPWTRLLRAGFPRKGPPPPPRACPDPDLNPLNALVPPPPPPPPDCKIFSSGDFFPSLFSSPLCAGVPSVRVIDFVLFPSQIPSSSSVKQLFPFHICNDNQRLIYLSSFSKEFSSSKKFLLYPTARRSLLSPSLNHSLCVPWGKKRTPQTFPFSYCRGIVPLPFCFSSVMRLFPPLILSPPCRPSPPRSSLGTLEIIIPSLPADRHPAHLLPPR